MAEAISRRLLTAQGRVQTQASPCGTWVGQSDYGTGFSPNAFSFSPVTIVPTVLHTHSFIHQPSKLYDLINW